MSDKPLPFVITDRRRHTTEGEVRPDADPREARPAPVPEPAAAPAPVKAAPAASVGATSQAVPEIRESALPSASSGTPDSGASDSSASGADEAPESDIPPPPTAEQMEQSRLAFAATADRLDTAIRAANPGADHPPALTFEALIQSVYMQAIMQLGGGTPEGQQPQIDILGARQSIDMLSLLGDKTENNLSEPEKNMLLSAIFELRLAFLEVTQALARSAQGRASAAAPPPPGGPRIVR